MKPFRFPLQRLLDLSGQRRRQAEVRLGQSLIQEGQARASLEAARELRDTAARRRTEEVRQGVPAGLLTVGWGHQRSLAEGVEQAAIGLEQAAIRVEEARTDLSASRRKELVYDRLRSRQWREHQREVERLRQKVLDDQALGRWEPAGRSE